MKNTEDFHGPRRGEWMEVGGVGQGRGGVDIPGQRSLVRKNREAGKCRECFGNPE